MLLVFQIDRGNLRVMITNTASPHNKINVMKDIDSVPSNVQSASREALLYVFEDNEAVIKMIMKSRSPTMRHVSRTHRVALDWLFDRINLDPKIQIKYIDTKNQLADILTKGNFTREEWNHLLTLFNMSHFSSTACIAAVAKRAQQESGEGRVTAKSRPMMNLTARTPSVVSSSASSNPGRTSYGYQDPERYVLDDRTGQPVETSRSDYLQQDYIVDPGLLKSGKVELENAIDRGNLRKILGIHCKTLTLIVKNIFSAGLRILQGTKRLFTIERGNLCQRIKERSTYSQILCYVSAKFFNILNATKLGRTELQEYEPREATEINDATSGESTEFEWNIFPGFTTLQICDRISDLLSSLGQTPESFTRRILFMSMFNDIFCDRYDNKDECLKNANYVKTFAGRFGQWSFIGPGSEKRWYSSENSPQGAWDHVAEEMLLLFAESGHPIFRSTTPLSRGQLKSKRKGKVSIHFTANQDTIDTIYRIILSVNQLSVYGAVAAICEEFEDHQDRTGQPVILVGQSIVLGEVKAEAPAQEEPEDAKIILQKYFQQVKIAFTRKQIE